MHGPARRTNLPFVIADVTRPPRRRTHQRSTAHDISSRSAGKILLLGRIRELALYRSQFLQSNGFEVIAPDTRAQAIDAIRHSGFEVAILTYTLPNEVVLEYAQLLREHCPACPLIVISNSNLVDRSVAPDAIVIADHGPEALLETLRKVMRNKS